MTDPNVAAFRLRFPEFSAKSDGLIAFAIEEATLLIGSLSTTQRPLSLLYYAAHIISSGRASSENSGAAGEIVSDSIGRVSRTIGTNTSPSSADVSELKTTYYGRRYLQVVRVGTSPVQVL